MKYLFPIMAFSVFVANAGFATLPQKRASQAGESDSAVTTETVKLATEIDTLNKSGQLSDEQVKKAIDGFFALPRQKEEKGAAFAMISSLGLLELTKKADPVVVAAALRPYLKDPETIWRAVEQAGTSPEVAGELVPELMNALKDPNPKVRYFAARDLGKAGPKAKSAVSLLAHTLQTDDDESVRDFSAEALGLIGEASPDAIRALLQAIHKESASSLYTEGALEVLEFDPTPYVSELVACADLILMPEPVQKKLNILGAKAVPGIIAMVSKKDIEERGMESEVLISIGEPAEQALVPLLKSEKAIERWLAVTSLSGIRNQRGDDGKWLEPFFNDQENAVRYAAIYGYAESSAPIETKLEVLRKGLETDDGDIRRGVAITSGDLGAAAKPLLPELVTAMRASDGEELSFARALLKIDTDNAEARSVVRAQLKAEDQEALGDSITSLSFDPVVAALFQDELKSVSQDAKTSSKNREKAVSLLREIQEKSSPHRE